MKLLFSLLAFSCLAAAPGAGSGAGSQLHSPKIVFQNSIVTQVNEKTISMMDVKKKLDLTFHRNYPHLLNSEAARLQFYQQSWRQALTELIDHELILSDASDKEIKITDGEIREEFERRFGPNTMTTLDQIGLTPEEALKFIKDEMIVQRMSWWFIHMKAMQSVTPEDIRQAYRLHLKSHPSFREWKYQVLSIRGNDAEELGKKVLEWIVLEKQTPQQYEAKLKELVTPSTSVQLSQMFTSKETDLSDLYKKALAPLSAGTYSSLVNGKNVSRIFYCQEIVEHLAPTFEEMNISLREQLIQEAIGNESTVYIEKLRKKYGYDASLIHESITENPFSLQ